MSRRALAGCLAALGLLVLTGCGGAEPSTPPASSAVIPGLPPRPATLSAEGVKPCELLTEAQRTQLGLGAAQPNAPVYSGPNQGPGCVWNSLHRHPDYGYTGGFVINRGVDAVNSREPPRVVAGFGAVTTGTVGTDPAYYCQIFLDSAPNQAFSVSFANNGDDIPGMNHQLACDKAQQAAELMLANLRAATHQ
jgi:hypothetical protein